MRFRAILVLTLDISLSFISSSPGQNGRHFVDDVFKRIFLNENARFLTKISLKFLAEGPIYNNPALV